MMERRVRSFITSRSGISSQFVQSGTVLRPILQTAHEGRERQVSIGAVWGVGGLAPNGSAVDNGRPQELHGDTNAPLYQTSFSKKGPATEAAERDMRQHEARLAMALKLDRVQRVLKLSVQPSPYKECLQPSTATVLRCKTTWDGIQWAKEGSVSNLRRGSKTQTLITAPFRVLDAPNLRDDFYCSMLAYSPTSHTLVVALGNMLYLWSEQLGARLIDPGAHDNDWITSVAFSSAQGRKGILAYARSNSKMTLMSIRDGEDLPNNLTVAPRFEVNHPAPVTSLSWKPTYTIRPSQNPFDLIPSSARTEELLVGDYAGQIWYYSVEWPERWDYKSKDWRGEMTLLAVIRVHTQQICGLSWSPSGDLFATGGNDNVCFLFETGKIMQRRQRVLRRMELPDTLNYENICGRKRETVAPVALEVGQGLARHKWVHGAAVKAIAFCPWQQGLVATGGGSHDKCIHFFHTSTGAQLAGIDVSAQVTSLIWSTTRRQIVATFGYANPDHPYRMAVFSWPDCRQVAAIPWEGEHRALYAISYPSQPTYKPEQSNCRKRRSRNPTATDSCIAVAASDQVVKFYQVWPSCQTAGGKTNTLGGRDILEDLDSFDKESDIIR
ncbi:hypothetical protein VTK73DRAFT_7319 [Phialemonium thermophilum]|uniref:Uncharacterized protein n=1 Tax=Phialemonium thermophilum TaxID=223376 RepID=A0ABR3XTT6_9PEZI